MAWTDARGCGRHVAEVEGWGGRGACEGEGQEGCRGVDGWEDVECVVGSVDICVTMHKSIKDLMTRTWMRKHLIFCTNSLMRFVDVVHGWLAQLA
jgi:hypothetical protein